MTRSIHPPRRRAMLRRTASTLAAALALAAAPLATSAAFAAPADHSVTIPDDPTEVHETGGTPNLTVATYDLGATAIEVVWGDTISLVAPAGFWGTGPDGEWTEVDIAAALTASGGLESYTGKEVLDLPLSLSGDGTTLTVQLPNEEPTGLDPVTSEPLPEDQLGSWTPGAFTLDVAKVEPGTETALDGLSIWLTLDFNDPIPEEPSEPTASLSQTSVGQDGSLTVTGSGFEPGEAIEIWLHSTPALLFSGTSSGSGAVSQTVTIPSGTAPGAHQIEIRGATSGSVFSNLTVLNTLAATGVEVTAGLIVAGVLLMIGLALILTRRRRAKHSA